MTASLTVLCSVIILLLIIYYFFAIVGMEVFEKKVYEGCCRSVHLTLPLLYTVNTQSILHTVPHGTTSSIYHAAAHIRSLVPVELAAHAQLKCARKTVNWEGLELRLHDIHVVYYT